MMIQHLNEAIAACEALIQRSEPMERELEQDIGTAQFSFSSLPLPSQDWMEACQTMGNILTGMGVIEHASTWRSMGLLIEPDRGKFYEEAGRIFTYCEQWEQAIYCCEQLLVDHPDHTPTYHRMARLYNKVGNYKAEGQIMHALLMRQPTENSAKSHFKLGQSLAAQGQLARAVECYQQAIARNPEFVQAYYALGDLWLKQGNYEETIDLFQQLAEQMPNEAHVHHRLGRAYRQTQQLELAILSFRRALQLDPELRWAYMGLLNTLLQLQRWEETLETCRGIIHFIGESPWVYCFMGNALSKSGQKEAAIASHQKAFSLRGWSQPEALGYEFAYTWFGENIPLWERYLAPLIEPAERLPLRVLSLGSGDDSSLCWLVDNILQQPDDQLLCMTTGASEQFKNNTAKLPDASKLILKEGPLPEQLDRLSTQLQKRASVPLFDIIYLQSKNKQADYIQQLAMQAWPLLKPDGVMIFRAYRWQHPTDASQSSQVGIDAFVKTVSAQRLHQSHQLILRKERE